MNTLMGDPTTEKLLPLIDAAADAGAEVFCIDAGWYDDGRLLVGQRRRVAAVAAPGSRAGSRRCSTTSASAAWCRACGWSRRWSASAARSPTSCRPRRSCSAVGVRVRRARPLPPRPAPPAPRVAHLDEVVDRLVEELGVGYFKLDYNIDPGAGTDHDADSAGAGLLAHNRAHLAWLDGRARPPSRPGAGELRVGRHADGLRDAVPDAAAVDQRPAGPAALPADRGRPPRCRCCRSRPANWAYPQPDMTDEEIAFTLCTGDARPALPVRAPRRDDATSSGRSVREAVRAHREIAHLIARRDADAGRSGCPAGTTRGSPGAATTATSTC